MRQFFVDPFFVDPFFDQPVLSLPFPNSDRVIQVGKGRLFITPTSARSDRGERPGREGKKGAGPGETRELPALLFRFPDGTVVIPRREERESARAAVRALGLAERGTPAHVVEGITWELAARRTAALLLGPGAGICQLQIRPVRRGGQAAWEVSCPVPLGWISALLGLQVPTLEFPGGNWDLQKALLEGRPDPSWFSQNGTVRGVIFHRPGREEDLSALQSAAARLGLETRIEPLPLAADRQAVELAARLAILLRGKLPGRVLADWEEIEVTARAFWKALGDLDQAIALLEVWTGRESEWSRLRAARDALHREKHLPRTPEELLAVKVTVEKAARQPLPDTPAGVPVITVGPFRLAISILGELRPLHEMEAPDPDLLEKEADRLEALARAYRARARELRGEGEAGGTTAGPVRYRAGRHAE